MNTPTALTVEAWIKTTSGSQMAILDRDDMRSSSTNRVFQFRLDNGRIEFIKIGGAGGIISTGLVGSSLNDGNPHYVAATYDGSSILIYADGV